MMHRSPHSEHVVDDAEIINNIVRCVDEEARGNAVVCTGVLGSGVHLIMNNQKE